MTIETYVSRLPRHGFFQVQLEGGEPTLHPQFWEFVRIAQSHPRCDRLVLCTNGVVLPRKRASLTAWLERFGERSTIKLSINHHLLDRDPELISLAALLRNLCAELDGDRLLVLSVRRRRGYDNDDQRVVEAVAEAGLLDCANVFYLKRYGFASDETTFDEPFPAVAWNFSMINPDGKVFGPDLVRRTEAMRQLS